MKKGLSTCGKTVNEEFFINCRSAGIDCIELSMSDENCISFDYSGTKELADRYGIELWSYHLPFAPFSLYDISSADEQKRIFTVKHLTELLNKAASVCSIKHFIVHPSAEPIDESDRECRLENACRSLCELADAAAVYNAVICAEDLPRTCLGRSSDEILLMLEADSRLKVCFDTNHLLNEDNSSFIERCAEKIVTTHISDYDYIDEKHWLPGEGRTDWHKLYTELKNTGYTGPWLYELGFKPSKTIERRELTAFDFSRNADEIFEGKEITVIGKPKSNE